MDLKKREYTGLKKKLILAGNNQIILKEANGGFAFPEEGQIRLCSSAEMFGFGNYVACFIENIDGVPDGCVKKGLRESWGLLPHDEYYAAVKGAELVNWSGGERFCSCCGMLLERAGEISKRCPKCGREYFPRLNPAMVVLVTRGEEALLVHARNFNRPGMMALVAGFVETGESLEECVRREIKEETNLDVEDIRYVASQSWPFPYQLMVGFTARYAGGELRFADGELSAGGFFTRSNVPELPTPPSLSREIIDMWVRGEV